MAQVVRLILAVAVCSGLLALYIWMHVAVLRRNRRRYIAHPQRRPYGWKLVLRWSPFVVIGVGCAVALAPREGWGWYIVAVAVVVLVCIDVWQRWRHPDDR